MNHPSYSLHFLYLYSWVTLDLFGRLSNVVIVYHLISQLIYLVGTQGISPGGILALCSLACLQSVHKFYSQVQA